VRLERLGRAGAHVGRNRKCAGLTRLGNTDTA
jgi:hypothetical protein